jgi:hypothetical protein
LLTESIAIKIRKYEASPVREREVVEKVVMDSLSPRRSEHLVIERSPSRHRSGSRVREEIIEKREVSRTRPRSASVRYRRQSSPVRFVERRDVIEDFNSSDVHVGPLVLVEPRRRGDREIREEILDLEGDREVVRLERRPVGSMEIIKDKIIDRGDGREEVIEVRKDRKGTMSLARKRRV